MEKYIVVEGFGDFDTPANCWGVEVIGSFSCEAECNECLDDAHELEIMRRGRA
jgi:hypothetical protein